MKLLIDADILLYQHSYAAEEEYRWDDGLHTLVSDDREARQRMEGEIAGIERMLGCSNSRLCFSGSDGWRAKLYPEYKANRTGKRKPLAFTPLKEWFLENRDCVMWRHLEADDAMGILATREPGECVIVSTDKDMKSIPGLLFNPTHDEFPQEITQAQADRWHLFQTLTGDVTDNYPGCRGVGPVKANQILGCVPPGDTKAAWLAVLAAFKRAGFTEAEALVQAKLARILRDGEWNFETGEVAWQPQ